MALFAYRDADFYLHHSLSPTPNPADFSTHMHSVCEAYCFISGQGSFHVEGSEYPLLPGTVILSRPGELHRLQISAALPYERIALHFPSSILSETDTTEELQRLFFDRPLGRQNAYRGNEDAQAFIIACFYRLCRPVRTLQPRTQILANLLPILCELCTLRENSEEAIPSADGLAAEVMAYINTHLFESWTLDDLAAHFFFSRAYLSRVFRQSAGVSIWDYTLFKRLLAARAMIRTGTPALEAASSCGFGDYSSFFRQYKRRFGISPQSDKAEK